MKKILPLLLVVVISLLFYGCHKSNADSADELLSASGWRYADFEKREVISHVPRPWQSYLATWGSCTKDNITYFKPNGSYEENEGMTKCGTNFPDAFNTGSWAFLSNHTQLKVSVIHAGMQFTPYIYDVNILDKHTLQITRRGFAISFPIGGGEPDYEELRWTFTH